MNVDSMSFQLRRLRLLSPVQAPAEVIFRPGLNAISGASDTGKSFIVELLQYALGKQEMKNPVAEAEPYDRVTLTFEAANGTVFTVLRGLSGGDAYCYLGENDQPPEGHPPVSVRSSGKETETLPGLLLELSGLMDKRIKISKGETSNLYFRHLRSLVVVEEERIISRSSPAQGGEITDRTSAASVFSLLITGMDDSAMVLAELLLDEREEKRHQAEKIAYMIEQLKADVPDNTTLRSTRVQLRRLDASIAAAQASYNEGFASVSKLESIRGGLIRRQSDVQVRVRSLNQLVERFRVLDRKYSSDVERLSTVGEAAEHFATLQQRNCPVCGSPLDKQTAHHQPIRQDPAMFAGLQVERQKILSLQLDLHNTIEKLVTDITDYTTDATRMASELRSVEERLDRKLKPEARELAKRLSEFEETRGHVRRLVSDLERIDRLKNQRVQLLGDVKTLTATPTNRNDSKAKFDFCLQVEKVLEAWKFPDGGRVHFDDREQDLVINGKPRGSLGKGKRAVTAAAFLVALMEYCLSSNLPHPGFLVLDTPLRTFKDREHIGGKDAPVGDEVKEAFWRDLASREHSRQFIVMENDEPPEDLRDKFNYVFFSGANEAPPAGFIPPRRS